MKTHTRIYLDAIAALPGLPVLDAETAFRLRLGEKRKTLRLQYFRRPVIDALVRKFPNYISARGFFAYTEVEHELAKLLVAAGICNELGTAAHSLEAARDAYSQSPAGQAYRADLRRQLRELMPRAFGELATPDTPSGLDSTSATATAEHVAGTPQA